MRTASLIIKIIMWTLMGLFIIMNGAVIVILAMNGEDAAMNYTPIAASVGLMLAACILFTCVKKLRPLWIGLAVLAAFIMVAVSPEMLRAFPVSIGADGTNKGLSVTKLILRHTGIMSVAVCMFAAWLTGRAADKQDEMRRDSYVSQYDLSGESLFRDSEHSGEADDKKRVKRSVRKRMEKERK